MVCVMRSSLYFLGPHTQTPATVHLHSSVQDLIARCGWVCVCSTVMHCVHGVACKARPFCLFPVVLIKSLFEVVSVFHESWVLRCYQFPLCALCLYDVHRMFLGFDIPCVSVCCVFGLG